MDRIRKRCKDCIHYEICNISGRLYKQCEAQVCVFWGAGEQPFMKDLEELLGKHCKFWRPK